jgi:dihydroxyacetone kinase-like predicted kinase
LTAPEYEVMYALRGAAGNELDALREELSELGHSVVVVGDRTIAQVHVHLADAGAAVEAALGSGTISQLRITALPPESVASERAVLAVVAGPGLAKAVESLGGIPVPAVGGQVTLEELTTAADTTFGDLVVLPNDMESLEIAHHHAMQWRRQGRRVAVIPTVAQVQGLAAIAVHEPTADFDSAVIAMSSAAGHARHGAVTVAEGPAMTMAGRCEPGDVLGAVEGDFVEIGDSVSAVAWRVIERLLSAGGELLTVVRGAGAEQSLVDELVVRLHNRSPLLHVEVLDGGQPRYLLLLGLE